MRQLTESLTANAKTPFLWNRSPLRIKFLEEQDSTGGHFTADFLVTREGNEVLFIEGGPPHHFGAHPCCFRFGEIEGVALTGRNGGQI